jgi:acetyl-CoA C-acetyltransferase
MPEAVIVAAARTPIARARKGSMVDIDAVGLARIAVGGVIDRAGIDPAFIDDIVVAESLQGGGVIARYVAVTLGLLDVPGLANNRHCAAGLSAVQIAAASIRAGMDQVVVAGGTESMSSMPRSVKSVPASANNPSRGRRRATPTALRPLFDMSITVGENTARIAGITREEADAWAMGSHLKAWAQVNGGHFDAEIIPVEVPDGAGGTRLFSRDEHPRPETTMDTLAALRLLHPEIPNAIITPGNSSGINDAAAAVMIVSDEFARAHGLTPLARVVSWASVGIDPIQTGLAPTRRSLALCAVAHDRRHRPSRSTRRSLDGGRHHPHPRLDPAIVNPYGSGCGLGHPIAATGARQVTSMIHELHRQKKSIGVVSMCAGGGMGSALVLEAL